MPIFYVSALANLFMCSLLSCWSRDAVKGPLPDGFQKHQQTFLFAWALCISGGWFTGPSVFALYDSFGFSRSQISHLFLLGYLSSALAGVGVGRFADRFGRKLSVLLCCAIGITGCACKHIPSYPVLVFGRILDDAHGALIHTAFESWLASAHLHIHEFPDYLLGQTFSLMFSLSFFCAVACGFVAQIGVNLWSPYREGLAYFGGWTVAYDMSALFQIAGFVYVYFRWEENYGVNSQEKVESSAKQTLAGALLSVGVMVCGTIVCLFESSMFIFVFNWSKALSPEAVSSNLPCGVIFATYMMACTSGAAVFKLSASYHVAHVALVTTCLAACAMAVPALLGISEGAVARNFLAFLVFEFCVGAYYPAMAKLKSEFVSDAHRSLIYNIFRGPLNLIVFSVLLINPSITVSFRVICAMLTTSSVILGSFCYYLQHWPNSRLEENLLPSVHDAQNS
eukprot:TRINITY_DN45066_c0_g1_i1.p1 TRINITY_DN45066_c0_g1~~TRINITY_DN45066_c0_g1_i1.p1  ORF type:complete len:468 (-),score=55.03 TRINITY_DN45066_c0_g1_i1:22-1380(-)